MTAAGETKAPDLNPLFHATCHNKSDALLVDSRRVGIAFSLQKLLSACTAANLQQKAFKHQVLCMALAGPVAKAELGGKGASLGV